jgi:hypothetical protein
MKALRNKLGTFMLWKVDGIFACHIMNMHSRPPGTFMMWIVCEMLADFLLSIFIMKTEMPMNRKKENRRNQ